MYQQLRIEWSAPPSPLLVDRLEGILCEYDHLGWAEEDYPGRPTRWTVYFAEDQNVEAVRGVVDGFLAAQDEVEARVDLDALPDQDWTEPFKAFFHAARVEPCWWVAPPWETDTVELARGDHLLIVDPGMAFGTGFHETTRMCLQMLAEHVKPGTRVLDVGAGSGILSVAVVRLGGRPEAFEIDEAAAGNLRHNLELNQVEDAVDVYIGDFGLMDVAPAPVVVCNMERQHFIPIFPALLKAVASGGILLATGFIDEGHKEIEDLFTDAGLGVCETLRMGEWIAFTAKP